MPHHELRNFRVKGSASPSLRGRPPTVFRLSALAAGLVLAASAQAVDFGPFSIKGFAKAEVQRGTNVCIDCQKELNENRQRLWADDLVYGKAFGTETTHVTLFQPYFGFKTDLGQGFKVEALLSQRYRDGSVDIRNAIYERNVALTHEEYGSVRVGAMTSRAWGVADFPYGTNVGVPDVWASSGAGYALLGHAIRYTSRMFDVLEGDLVMEATYDTGTSGWQRNKPQFLEVFGQYVKGDLVVDAMYQVSRNGEPLAWGHAPFTGLTAFPQDDDKLGSSGQSIVLVMARYQVDSQIEVSGGIRFNRWSGAYAVPTTPGRGGLWNNMFNVDWNGVDANGVQNPGYAARSTDLMLGLRYRMGAWTASTGMVYLGKASTDNPSERGQSNTLTLNTVGLTYDFGNGLQLYGMAGMVHYGKKGLAPLSMPSNNAFTNVDPRVATRGNWFGAGAVYTF